MRPFARLLARRTLFSQRSRTISLLGSTALFGIALSVAATIGVTGILFGFQKELDANLIGLNAHITVRGDVASKIESIRSISGVADLQQVIEGEILLRAVGREEEEGYVARLRGVAKLPEILGTRFHISPKNPEPFTLAGGEEILLSLGLFPGVGKKGRLIYPFGEIGPSGDWVPKQREIQVSHLFRTGLYDWDAYQLLVPLDVARSLLGEQGRVSFLIYLKEMKNTEAVVAAMRPLLAPSAVIETFASQNERLFAALKLERFAILALLGLFVLIAGFSVTGLLLLFVGTKRRDMAVLRGIGLGKAEVGSIFRTMGLFLGIIGSLVGALIGGIGLWFLDSHPIRLPSTYYLEFLPVELNVGMIGLIFAAGLLLTWIASRTPARQAEREPILELLREE